MSRLGVILDRVDDSVVRKPFVGTPLEFLTIALIAIVPFLPRPTLDHPVRFAVPLFIVLLVVAIATDFLGRSRRVPAAAKLTELAAVAGLLFFVYFGWSIASGHAEELSRVIARGLWLAVYVGMIAWMFSTGISTLRVYRLVFLSTVVLSVLVLFVGVTGATIFEAPRPGRTYGFVVPFYKNTGIPRSYGEFGILISMAWAFLLVNFRQLGPAIRISGSVLLLSAIFISQSRSTWLASLIILGVFFVGELMRHRSVRTQRNIYILMFLGTLLVPAILELLLLSPFGRLAIVEAIVGEQTFEENVLARFLIIGSAVDALLDGGASALLGISHEAWLERFALIGDEPIALHNHFLSNLVFYGIIAGTLSLVVFVFWPFMRTVRRQVQHADRTSRVALLAMFGTIVNLHFYEGFFSLILALQLALLWCTGRGIMLETRTLNVGPVR